MPLTTTEAPAAATTERLPDDRPFVRDAGTLLAYAYLLRVPLLIWLALAALPLIAVPRNAFAGSLLRGLFDIVDQDARFWSIALTFGLLTLAALFVAITVAITARLILLDGSKRFAVRPLPASDGIQVLVRLLPLIAAVMCTVGAWVQTWPTLKPSGVLAAFIGTAVAVAVCWVLMTSVHDRLWKAVFRRRAPKAESTNVIYKIAGFPVWLFKWVIRQSPQGFVGDNGAVLERHMFALLQFMVSIVFYLLLFLLKSNLVSTAGAPPRIPTLCLIFVLAMLAGWSLSGITFFFDRFRVPLLTVLFAYGTATSIFPAGDHFFKTADARQPLAASLPASVVLQQHEYEPAIVVAAAGGGIQAAAWTARVLSQIAQDSDRCGTDFGKSLMAVSGVSGGSVGAMYFLDAYDANGQLNKSDAANAETAASLSSLDEVAWGLTYPDLVWGLFPFAKGFTSRSLVKDRGSALEDSWKRTTSLGRATLDGWRDDLSKRLRPAALFNATVAETGEQMILGTTTFDNGRQIGRREFSTEYPDLDVQVATAVRMSATFPYVSPAARVVRHPLSNGQNHYVDGGYYDNYGTATLIQWLESGLERKLNHSPSMILMIEIRSFPDTQPSEPGASRGWVADVVQPLRTLYEVRGSGQAAHSLLNVHLMEDDWNFWSIPITFPPQPPGSRDDEAPPLSWHLTPRDQRAITRAWDDPDVKKSRVLIQEFLGRSEAYGCIG